MSYEPTIWRNGDKITEEKMNKLEQGVLNQQVGAAAGFGTPTATVDDNTGTPEVEVTASGPDTAKIFEFAFKNMKGPKGDPGAGLTGEATSLEAIATPESADAATVAAKTNEIIAQLKARGIVL